MLTFIQKIKNLAVDNPKRVIFPEALLDERILQAVELIVKERTTKVMLLGDLELLRVAIAKYKLAESEYLELVDFSGAEELAKEYMKARSHKNLDFDFALKKMRDVNYYGAMMVKVGRADGMISGTTFSTADTVRPALELLVTKDGFRRVSGFFFLMLGEKLLIFADCAINIDPSPEDLAGIALDTAETAKSFGIIPKVAMLSFSTNHSAFHPLVEKVRVATQLIRSKDPDLLVDGEIQVDAALVPKVANKKCPDSPLQGDANILIFPNLEAGNIGYKLVERLAKAKAIGPILQGLNKPVNDLSRGCDVMDIVNLAAITSYQAQFNK